MARTVSIGITPRCGCGRRTLMSQQDQQQPRPKTSEQKAEDTAKAIIGYLLVATWLVVLAIGVAFAYHLFTH
jgi:hypothetical protein